MQLKTLEQRIRVGPITNNKTLNFPSRERSASAQSSHPAHAGPPPRHLSRQRSPTRSQVSHLESVFTYVDFFFFEDYENPQACVHEPIHCSFA